MQSPQRNWRDSSSPGRNHRETTRSLALGSFPDAAAICRRDRQRIEPPARIFPPKGETTGIDGNAIRDWTPHMISRTVPAVLFVCRNREDLAWISAFKLDCSYLQSLFLLPPSPQQPFFSVSAVSASYCVSPSVRRNWFFSFLVSSKLFSVPTFYARVRISDDGIRWFVT